MVWRLRNMAFLPKLKIAIVFYQNMLSIPVVYGLTVPPDWYRWLYVFSWVNLDVLDIYEAECMGDVESQLNMTALGSLVVVVGILVLGALFVVGMRLLGAPSTSKAGTSLREQMILLGLPWALFAVFALVPGVSRTIFRVWSCKKFIADDGDGSAIEFLVMRMSVVCGSEEHESSRGSRSSTSVFGPSPSRCSASLLWCPAGKTSGRATLPSGCGRRNRFTTSTALKCTTGRQSR